MEQEVGEITPQKKYNQPLDPALRIRIFFAAGVIAFSLFLIKLLQPLDVVSWQYAITIWVVYFVLTTVSLIWALRKLNLKTLSFVAPQTSIFISFLVLFSETFLLRRFERIYEVFILIIVTLIILVASYASLLMSNIFSVSLIKKIPLYDAAKTTSYIITIITIYCITFSLLSIVSNEVVLMILLAISYFVVVFLHLKHYNLIQRKLILYSIGAVWAMLVSIFAFSLWGSSQEVIAMIPATIALVMIGLLTEEIESINKKIQQFEYFLILIVVFVIAVIFSR